MKLTQSCSRHPRRLGAAAVEFALVAPLFLMLLLGIIEFGRGLMVQQLLVNATRAGAREAALPGSTSASVESRMIEFLSACSVTLTEDDVSITPDPETTGGGESITVSVEIPYSRIGWIPGSFLSDVTLRASTMMRSERMH